MTTNRNQTPSSPVGYRVLLLTIAVAAFATVLAMPWLIVPYNPETPWYESTALFPRVALCVAGLGAVIELVKPHARSDGSDELDASESRAGTALLILAIFIGYAFVTPIVGFLISTALFATLAGIAARLKVRTALALAIPLALVLWFVFSKLLHVAFGGYL